MIRNRYTCIVILGLSATLAGAQTLTSPENIPVVGTSFLVHRAAYAAPSPAGTGQTFDYSGLTMTSMATYACIDPDTYSNAAAFPTAEVAVAINGDTVFYRNASAGLEKVGERRTYLSSYAVEAPLSDGMIELKLPLVHADTWTDLVAGTITVNGDPATRNGVINGVADATGTLILPGGATAQVLRVRTRVEETTSFNVGIPVTVTHKRTEYAFYAPYLKMPMLRVYGDSLAAAPIGITQNTSGIEWLDASVLGVAEDHTDAFGMTLYPNPASTAVDISYLTFGSDRMTIEVTDARGAVVLRKDLGRRAASLQRERLDVGLLEAGLYQVALTDAQGARSVKRLTVVR